MNSNQPSLIEPGVKYFLSETLKKCSEYKNIYYNIIFNVSLFFIFLVILGSILLVKYKGKLTPSEKEIKNREKHYYIISKIKNYQEMKLMNQQNLITGLPRWDNEYDLLHNK